MQKIITKDDFVLALASPADANVTTASRPWRQVCSTLTSLPLLSRQSPVLLAAAKLQADLVQVHACR